MHSNRSTAARRYVCSSEGCEENFKTNQELSRHKKFICGKEREFECEKCMKTFYLYGGLLKHQRKCLYDNDTTYNNHWT